MIFADKLMELRKKNGMTQEELAEQMHVSRQSVSKWEGAQSVPDLDKVLCLSKLFGVTTDYLLKDELEAPEFVQVPDDTPELRQVTLEEASGYLEAEARVTRPMAAAVGLCILSPIALLLLGAFAEAGYLSEGLAGGAGIVILLGMIAVAVAIFLFCGSVTEEFRYLETESFETAYGVDGMVRERKKQFRDTYTRHLALGVGLCILCPVPLLIAAFVTENELTLVAMVCVLLGIVALAVGCIMRAVIPWEAMQKLLQEGDFTPAQKRISPIQQTVGAVYWLTVTAVFLICCFAGVERRLAALLWPIAGVLYGAVVAVCRLLLHRKC